MAYYNYSHSPAYYCIASTMMDCAIGIQLHSHCLVKNRTDYVMNHRNMASHPEYRYVITGQIIRFAPNFLGFLHDIDTMLELTPPDLPHMKLINLGLAISELLQIKVLRSRVGFLRTMVSSQKLIDLELALSDLWLALSQK